MKLTKRRRELVRSHVPVLLSMHREQVPWLNGIAIGQKVTSGLDTGQDAIVFFVAQKVDGPDLQPEHILPTELEFTDKGKRFSVPTDVVSIGSLEFTPGANCFTANVIAGGTCVSPKHAGEFGTCGGLVRDPAGTPHLLTNSHVLSAFGNFPLGHPVVQPAGSPRVIARLTRATVLQPGIPISADAAIARYDNGISVSSNVAGIGIPVGPRSPAVGMVVRASCSISGVRQGKIHYVGLSHNLNGFQFHDLFLATLGTTKGDSGSFVMDADGFVIGLVFARTKYYGAPYAVCCTAHNVIQELGLQGWAWN